MPLRRRKVNVLALFVIVGLYILLWTSVGVVVTILYRQWVQL